MRNSKDYVFAYLDFLAEQPIKRILLPDTLGVLIPSETYEYLHEIVNRYPHIHFDFHAHNDYDLGTANVLEAVKAGVQGLHLTVNGMGERAGRAVDRDGEDDAGRHVLHGAALRQPHQHDDLHLHARRGRVLPGLRG